MVGVLEPSVDMGMEIVCLPPPTVVQFGNQQSLTPWIPEMSEGMKKGNVNFTH